MLFFIAVTSCQKEPASKVETNQSVTKQSEAISTFSQVPLQHMALMAAKGTGLELPASSCYTAVPHYEGGKIARLDLDFANGCSLYGFTHKGKVELTISRNEYNTFVSQFNFKDYQINGLLVNGVSDVSDFTFLSVEFGSGLNSFFFYPNGLELRYKDQTFLLSGHIEFVRTEEGQSPKIDDDTYFVGVVLDGQLNGSEEFLHPTQGEMYVKPACQWPLSGKLRQNDLELDFGNGKCDNEAVLTQNGQSKTIFL